MRVETAEYIDDGKPQGWLTFIKEKTKTTVLCETRECIGTKIHSPKVSETEKEAKEYGKEYINRLNKPSNTNK